MSPSVTIIGGGQAGGTLAHTLVTKGYDGAVRLVCGEAEAPYERPPLSKGILGGEDVTYVAPLAAYDERGIDLRLGRSAVELRGTEVGWEVVLDDGESLLSDSVVLATGSRPRRLDIPGAHLGNVVSLSTLDHARRIQELLPTMRHAVIAGAGFVGTEVAASLRSRGVDVTIVEPLERPLEHVLGPWASAAVRDLHVEAGVTFVRDVVAEARGSGVVSEVVTGDGRVLPCDLFLMAIGSVPAIELAQAAGITIDQGVLCDDRGRTSAPGLHAIGDVASWPYGPLGQLRVEHFRTAIEHAEVVAAELVGEGTERTLVPWFWTDQYHRRVEVAGRPSLGDVEVLRRADDGTPRVALHLQQDRVVGVIGIDAPREVRAATQLIRQQSTVQPKLIEDPAIDLRKVATPA